MIASLALRSYGLWLSDQDQTDLVAAGIILLSVIVLVILPFTISSRRNLILLTAVALVCGIGGGIAYDRKFIRLNLALREADQIRDECELLFQRRKSKVEVEKEYISWRVPPEKLPPAIARLGAERVVVEDTEVRICFYTDWNGGESGVLYDPRQFYLTRGRVEVIRSTWHSGFYEFQIGGE